MKKYSGSQDQLHRSFYNFNVENLNRLVSELELKSFEIGNSVRFYEFNELLKSNGRRKGNPLYRIGCFEQSDDLWDFRHLFDHVRVFKDMSGQLFIVSSVYSSLDRVKKDIQRISNEYDVKCHILDYTIYIEGTITIVMTYKDNKWCFQEN